MIWFSNELWFQEDGNSSFKPFWSQSKNKHQFLFCRIIFEYSLSIPTTLAYIFGILHLNKHVVCLFMNDFNHLPAIPVYTPRLLRGACDLLAEGDKNTRLDTVFAALGCIYDQTSLTKTQPLVAFNLAGQRLHCALLWERGLQRQTFALKALEIWTPSTRRSITIVTLLSTLSSNCQKARTRQRICPCIVTTSVFTTNRVYLRRRDQRATAWGTTRPQTHTCGSMDPVSTPLRLTYMATTARRSSLRLTALRGNISPARPGSPVRTWAGSPSRAKRNC